MKQDILILSSHIDNIELTYDALAKHDIPATIVTDMQAVLSELHTHTPAFLWLDLDTGTAHSFLAEIVDRFLYPPPYIILTLKNNGVWEMEVETRTYVIGLLESCRKRENEITLLRYELNHFSGATSSEMIDAMAFAHSDYAMPPGSGNVSDKTLYIALNYQNLYS